MLCKLTTLPATTLKFLYGDGALINVRHLLFPVLCSFRSRVIEFLSILKEFIGRLLCYIQESCLTGKKFIKYINDHQLVILHCQHFATVLSKNVPRALLPSKSKRLTH